MDLEDLTRQRLDYQRLPNGGARVVLTVTLPNDRGKIYAVDLPASVVSFERPIVGAYSTPVKPTHVTKTGWTFGAQRVTTADVKALRNYLARGGEWLAKFSHEPQAQARLESDRDKIAADDTYAAYSWSTLQHHSRNWIRDHYNPKGGLLHDLGNAVTSIASNPIVDAAFPVLALNANPKLVPIRDAVVSKLGVPGASILSHAQAAILSNKKQAAADLMHAAAGDLASSAGELAGVDQAAHVAAASVLGLTGQLGEADIAARAGKLELAKGLTHQAIAHAHLLTKSDEAARDLLEHANRKRLAVSAVAAGKPRPKVATRGPHVDILNAARAGALRSNQPGDVSAETLRNAAASGRVFWIA